VVCLNTENQTGIGFLSDSNSNTWVELTEQTPGGVALTRLAYCLNPTVGAGHTFSWGHSDTQYWALAVAGFSGVATSSAFDQESGTAAGGSATITAPSFTPANANELVVSGMSYWIAQGTGAPAVSGGSFAVSDSVGPSGGPSYPADLAYWIQTTATAAAAQWTWTTATNASVVQAAFKAAGGGSIFNDSVSETLSSAETLTGKATFLGVLSETLSSADTVTSVAIFTGSLADTLSSAETTDATKNGTVWSGSVSETLTAAETPGGSAVFSNTLGEVLSVAETILGNATWPVSTSDTLSALETVTGLPIFSGSISETLAAIETPGSAAIFVGSLSEALTANDSPNSNAIMGVSTSDTLSVNETTTGVNPAQGNTVTIYGGVSLVPWDGVSKRAILLVSLGGNQYTVTYVNSVSDNRVDSVHNEWYIIV